MTPNPEYEALRSEPGFDWQRFSEQDAYRIFDSAVRVTQAINPPDDLRPAVFEGVKTFLGVAKQGPVTLGVPLDARGLRSQ